MRRAARYSSNAQRNWAVLIILQAMDAAGKDGLIKHVMAGVNPQGCQVHAFKQPSEEELNHELHVAQQYKTSRGRSNWHLQPFLLRRVLVVRVHPEVLKKERIPEELIGKDLWEKRFEDIGNVEKISCPQWLLLIRKFFLHLSKKEQKRRFLERLENAEKNWKFSAADVREREYWDDYMNAYEEMIAGNFDQKLRHGTWSQPTINGIRVWWWPQRLWTRSRT